MQVKPAARNAVVQHRCPVFAPAALGALALVALLAGPPGAVATAGLASAADAGAGGHATPLSIRVMGSHLIDSDGHVVQLHGADVSGLEFVAIQGWSAADPWGGQLPDLTAMKAWNLNAVRFPLNEASWLGLTTYDWPAAGKAATARKADPGGNYKQTVINSVNAAVAAGMYVILDLHLNSPDAVVPGVSGRVATSPTVQNVMADADHSAAFWSSVANTFKSNPAVIFDLFNEPHIDKFAGLTSYTAGGKWTALRDGAVATEFITSGATVQQNFRTAGMQSLLNAVRATGATNVVMVAGISWAQDTSEWVAYAPVDPLRQLAASWHAYPQGTSGSAASIPGLGTANYTWAQAILAAGYPIIIGETGDHSAAGTVGAPFLANLLPWVDHYNVSVLGWAWNVWGKPDDDLIKTGAGEPTDGFGVAYRRWTLSHSSAGAH
jgi:endoglucanase